MNIRLLDVAQRELDDAFECYFANGEKSSRATSLMNSIALFDVLGRSLWRQQKSLPEFEDV